MFLTQASQLVTESYTWISEPGRPDPRLIDACPSFLAFSRALPSTTLKTFGRDKTVLFLIPEGVLSISCAMCLYWICIRHCWASLEIVSLKQSQIWGLGSVFGKMDVVCWRSNTCRDCSQFPGVKWAASEGPAPRASRAWHQWLFQGTQDKLHHSSPFSRHSRPQRRINMDKVDTHGIFFHEVKRAEPV